VNGPPWQSAYANSKLSLESPFVLFIPDLDYGCIYRRAGAAAFADADRPEGCRERTRRL